MGKGDELRQLLFDRGLRPRHRFGQNFLIEPARIEQLVEASKVSSGDFVLEIGPGTGILTEALLSRGCKVVAVEIDRDLCRIVEEKFGSQIVLIEGDCLEGKHTLSSKMLARISREPFYLVSNLPYGCASPLLALIAIKCRNCKGMTVTVQREVADRCLAKPSTAAYGSLSVVIDYCAEVFRVANVPPGCFWPVPKVHSTMVKIIPRSHREPVEEVESFLKWVNWLFTSRRKQIGRIIGRSNFSQDRFDITRRPESFRSSELKQLWDYLGKPTDF